jgi:hypothetical protein
MSVLRLEKCQTPLIVLRHKIKTKGDKQMLTQTTLDKIVYEYQHGGVQSYRHSISMRERKALLRYLLSLPTKCSAECEATHTA